MTSVTEPPQWKICPVGISALAFVQDNEIGHMIGQKYQWRMGQSTFDFGLNRRHADLAHIQPGLAVITMRAWAESRFPVDLWIPKTDGHMLRYVDSDFAGIGELPHSILAALIGKPISAYVDHPVFHGLTFENQDHHGAPRGPLPTITVDNTLLDRIHARRAELVAAYPAPHPALIQEAACSRL